MEPQQSLSGRVVSRIVGNVCRIRLSVALLVLVGAAPAVSMFYLVTHYWVPLPYWDEWATPGKMFASWCDGTLTLPDLVSQHNESRKFFPRLLYLALAVAGGWDVRKEMLVCFATVCAIALLFYRLMRQTPGATALSAAIGWTAATFLCFSAVQLDNFLWGIQLEPFFPGLAVLAIAVVNTSERSLARKSLLNATLALIATYTFANGMLLWAIGVPTRGRSEAITRQQVCLSYGGYALTAALAIGAYFIHYERPANHPQLMADRTALVPLLHYLVLWVGSYFASPAVSPLAVGITAIAVFAAALIGAVVSITRNREWRSCYPALLIAAYACVTAAVTAVGRIGFGVEQALDSRYRTFSLFFYLAIVALLFALYCRSVLIGNTRWQIRFIGGCSVVAIAASAAWVFCYFHELRYVENLYSRNLTLIRALEWINVIPDNPDVLFIYPIEEQILERARVVRDHKLLRLPYPNQSVIGTVQRLPPDPVDQTFGRMETCMFDTNHNLYITGWARLPTRHHHADTIVIGCQDSTGNYKPFSVMNTELAATKTGRRSKTPLVRFARAFNAANVPKGEITIAAWAVDMPGEKAYPLGGATHIQQDQR